MEFVIKGGCLYPTAQPEGGPPLARIKSARCGGELYQRKDDNPETVKSRLDVYKAQTAPLIDYYTKKGVILNFTGSEAPAEVLFAEVAKTLDELNKQ